MGDDGMIGSSPECSAAPGTVAELATHIISEVAEDTSSRQMPADERQLEEDHTTTTQIPGTCSVPDLGAHVDSSDCQGKIPSESCQVTCTSGFLGTAASYSCNSEFTFSGNGPECTPKLLPPVCGYSLGHEVVYGSKVATVTCFAKMMNGADALGICSEGGGKHSRFSACASKVHTTCTGQLTFVDCSAVGASVSGSFRP